jgi:hypothetical protein
MSIFKRKKKPLSVGAIAMLAQAHDIHRMELEFAREQARKEARAELRQSVRDKLLAVHSQISSWKAWSQADVEDLYLVDVGGLFADTPEHQAEWNHFVRDRRIAINEQKFDVLHQQIERATRSRG